MNKRLLLIPVIALFSLSISLHAQDTPYVGEIIMVPYNFAPAGYADCDGQLLQISQNTALFSLLGTTYGGNGTSNFALPNLNGMVAIGAGQGPGLSNYVEGETGGQASVTLTKNQIPAHSHQFPADSAKGTTPNPGSHMVAANPAGVQMYAASSDTTASAVALGSTGGGQPHNNMMPYLGMKFVIALQGIYPARGTNAPVTRHK